MRKKKEVQEKAWYDEPPLGLGQQAALLSRVQKIDRWQKACHIFGGWFGNLEQYFVQLPGGVVLDGAPRLKITKPVADAIIAMRKGDLEAFEQAIKQVQ